MKLWTGRFEKEIAKETNDFNSSISFDKRMYNEDIMGSMAHATMLVAQGIISEADGAEILAGLEGILSDIDSGKLEIDPSAEDIHTFVEAELTKRIGDAGKKLHTGRSRNDQVALDIRLTLRKETEKVQVLLENLINTINKKAEEHENTIMPGYTHLQRAQPITFKKHLGAYSEMFKRDLDRLNDAKKRMNFSPLGAGALAGTTYPTDRMLVAKALDFDGICENTLDAVSDRDFCIELANALSIIMMHLSRFSEEIILWCSWEFKFVELDDVPSHLLTGGATGIAMIFYYLFGLPIGLQTFLYNIPL
ncbi:MAG: argininosuccinate lyase, partial [Clostridia bacterium]|nr:argininosuccinate lyase [Clostridia bacterium]